MKYILRVLIILIITLSTSACFDSLYHLQISHVQAPDFKKLQEDEPSCEYDAPTVDGEYRSYTEGLMDLKYMKNTFSNTHLYGYNLRLAVFNISDDNAKENVNTIHVRKATVKMFNQLGSLLNQEVIETDVTIAPQAASSIPIRIFNDRNAWENDGTEFPDTTDFTLYTYLYEPISETLTTDYVMVEVVLSGETLGGTAVTSDRFRFRINLCIGCLIQACPAGSFSGIVCGPQDHSNFCSIPKDTGK